jgi:hypothetical protein
MDIKDTTPLRRRMSVNCRVELMDRGDDNRRWPIGSGGPEPEAELCG